MLHTVTQHCSLPEHPTDTWQLAQAQEGQRDLWKKILLSIKAQQLTQKFWAVDAEG